MTILLLPSGIVEFQTCDAGKIHSIVGENAYHVTIDWVRYHGDLAVRWDPREKCTLSFMGSN